MDLSTVPFYWSSRPEGVQQDYLPTAYAEAEYFINFANLKAHPGAGVTLCAKNHYGSLIRTPPEKGYYDMHKSGFSQGSRRVPEPGGPDGPRPASAARPCSTCSTGSTAASHSAGPGPEEVPDRRRSTTTGRPACSPRRTRWRSTRWASISCWPRSGPRLSGMGGTDDYLHEAALADNPPSGTFYDPDHTDNARHAWPVSASTSTGTTRRTGSTPATWARMRGSSS